MSLVRLLLPCRSGEHDRVFRGNYAALRGMEITLAGLCRQAGIGVVLTCIFLAAFCKKCRIDTYVVICDKILL